MKKRTIVCSVLICVATIAAVFTRANSKFISARFISASDPGNCQVASDIPPGCVAFTQAQICTVTVFGFNRTYYQGTSCQTPYYKLP